MTRGAALAFDRQIVLLAFLTDFSLREVGGDVLEDVRAELRGLGAVLVVVSTAGVFVLRADDAVEPFAGDADAVLEALGVRRFVDGSFSAALFLVDEDRSLRFSR